MMDINLEAGHIVEISTAPSTPPKKLSVPILGLEKFPTQQEIEGQDARNRRPVRPIDRQRMRPWLMELLDLGNVFGLRWTNRNLGIFQISWRHASRLGWNLETDGDVFERWARHTGIYKEGDPPEPKRWKANFRCALHSLHDVLELTNAVERRGRNACRTYQFLQNNNMTVNPKSRPKERKPKIVQPKESRELVRVLTYERPIRQQPIQIQLQESGSSDDVLSETESEGSHQEKVNKVIVQRLDAKTGEVAEEEFLLHDHDYSGHQEKTQRTIYLRQGVGSIVLEKEVLDAPQALEDAKAAQALSNLEQLASAAVGSQDSESNTIMIDASVFSSGSNKGSPSKSSGLLEDSSEINLKTLLPRLRARIKESERAGGLIRKRKFLEAEPEVEEKRILGHNTYRLKKSRSETGLSPPSPPMTRRRSGSPKKQSKGATKAKRSRKESEESASDSTEPLMSSCLLLLEAATRLDNAEKGDLTGKASSKHGKKGDRSSDLYVSSKKRKGHKSASERVVEDSDDGGMDGVEREEQVIEEHVLESMEEAIVEECEETVIEETIIYPDDATMQVVYEDAIPQDMDHQTIKTEVQEEGNEQATYTDILRTALENIGSELEVSTSSPKELAIMRRKKDNEKSLYNALTVSGGQIVVTEASFAKGLFSGSEIVPNISQTASNAKRVAKMRSKAVNKDNIYYVDVRSNGGSICIKQSEAGLSGVQDVSSLSQVSTDTGVQHTIIKKELPSFQKPIITQSPASSTAAVSSPQIFIAAGQNASGQSIVLPINNQKLVSLPQTTLNTLKQTIGSINSGRSFISLGPQGKPIILKSNTTTATTKETAGINPMSSQGGLPSNVKISTLPIISTLKPIVSIPAPITSIQKKSISSSIPITASNPNLFPMHLIPNVSSTTRISPKPGVIGQQPQRVTLVPNSIGSVGQEGNKFILHSQSHVPSNSDSSKSQSRPIKLSMVASGNKSLTPGVAEITQSQLASSFPLTQNLVLSSTPSSNTNTSSSSHSQSSVQTFLVNSQNMELQSVNQEETTTAASGQGHEAELSADPNSLELSDFDQVKIISSKKGNQKFVQASGDGPSTETIKIEPQMFDNSSTITLIPSEGEDGGIVFSVKQEGTGSSEMYCVPVQNQELQVDSSSSGGAIQVEVQTSEMGDHTCFISPEQLEEANHIIHISQETEDVISSTVNTTAVAVDSGSLQKNDGEEEQPSDLMDSGSVKTEPEEGYSESVADSSNIDPRAPLSIREIPLFASSKGDSESSEDHNTD